MSDHGQPHARVDNDRCVLQSWHDWDIRDGERRIVLCVQTGLELRPGYAGFDASKIEACDALS